MVRPQYTLKGAVAVNVLCCWFDLVSYLHQFCIREGISEFIPSQPSENSPRGVAH